ncbi:MAG: hypothetical protein KJ725_20300 [Gammaproteobacteria bacterium]|nr:hypothetical protein [Gammaproteobacteria bacterium]
MSTPKIDEEQIRRTLAVLLAPGQVTEIRAFKARDTTTQSTWRTPTVSGYYDDPDALVGGVRTIDAAGVCFVPNPVLPDLLARANNRLRWKVEKGEATTDDHVTRRLWMLVDVDATASHKLKITSTDDEHEAALTQARIIATDLFEEGWPRPILADSGNGAHLLYRVDLPNDDDARTLAARCLEALSFRFSTDVVDVDTSTFNAARIWKLYGTMVRKGDPRPGRPHRMARLVDVPDPVDVVPRGLLEDLAGSLPEAPKPEAKTPQATTTGATFDLADWIAAHLPDAKGPHAWDKGRKWILPVCPFNADHARGEAIVMQFTSGAIAAGCQHNSCTWKWDDLRDKFEPEARERREAWEARQQQGAPVDEEYLRREGWDGQEPPDDTPHPGETKAEPEKDREELERCAPTMAAAYGLAELDRDKERELVSIAVLPSWAGYDEGQKEVNAGHGIGETMNKLIGGGLCLPYMMLIGARHAGAGKTTFLCQILDGLALRTADLVRNGKPGPLTPVFLLSEMPAALLTWRTLGRWTGYDSRLFRAGKTWEELGIKKTDHTFGWQAAEEALAPAGHLAHARQFQRVTNNPPKRGVEMVEWLRRAVGVWREDLAREHDREVWPVVALDPIQRWRASDDSEIQAQSDLAEALGRVAREEKWICFATSDTNKDSATGREAKGKDTREIGTAAFRGSYELQHACDAAVYLKSLRVQGDLPDHVNTPKGSYLLAGLVKNWWGEDLPSPRAWAGFRWYRSTGRFYPYDPAELRETEGEVREAKKGKPKTTGAGEENKPKPDGGEGTAGGDLEGETW